MPKKFPLTKLFPSIEVNLDMELIKSILLTLEEEQTKFKRLRKEMDELKNQLNLWEKVNPFSERDLKGEILKIKVEMQGLAEMYHKDISAIEGMVMESITQVDAFKSKFLTRKLSQKIRNISSSGVISGKNSALNTLKVLDKHFVDMFREQYSLCPTKNELTLAYLEYLLVPYHLTMKLVI